MANDSAANAAIASLGSAATVSARSYVTGVSSQSTAAAAISTIATTVAGVGSIVNGSTLALTTGVDALVGTLNNDLFTATDATFTIGDSLTGGLGVDRLAVSVSASLGSNPATVTLNSVDNVIFTLGASDLSTASGGVNAVGWTGVLTLGLKSAGVALNDAGSSGGAYFNNVQGNATLSLDTITVATNNANAIRVDFGSGKLGGATANLAITLAGGVGNINARADIAVQTAGTDAFSTLSIANAGASYLGLEKITGALSPTAITITGSGSLDLAVSTNADFTNLATVTATTASTSVTMDVSATTRGFTYSGGSGDATLILANVTNTVTTGGGRDTITIGGGLDRISTGAGNDTVITSLGNLSATDVIDLGDGSRDALVFNDVTSLAVAGVSADALTVINALKGIEVIGSSANVTAINMGYFTQTVFRLSGSLTSRVTVTNAVDSTLEFTGTGIAGTSGGSALDLSGAAANATVTLEFNASKGMAITANNGAATNTALAISSNISTVNILSTNSSGAASGSVVNIVGAAGTTVDNVVNNLSASSFVLTGSADFSIGAGGSNSGGLTASTSAGFTKSVIFDASNFNGRLTINSSQVTDVIKGGAGDDTIRGLGGNDTIDLTTGGRDIVVFSATAALNGRDSITAFSTAAGANQDVLNVAQFITTPASVTAIASLTGAASLANNSISIVNAGGAIGGKVYGGADFGDLFAATGKVFADTVLGGARGVVVVQGTDQTQVLFVDAALNGANTNVQSTDVSVVGVLSGVTSASTFVIGNFA